MEIKQMLVPDNLKPKYHLPTGPAILPMKPTYITIHETDNEAPTATDLAHARLQLGGNSRQASWHLQVDADSAIQSIPFDECAIHAGDGINGNGNRKSIAIEICVNKGADYKKAVTNAAEVTKYLMKRFNIPASNVVQHNHWSGKNCPRHLRAGDKGINWAGFQALLKDEPKKPVAPKYPGTPIRNGSTGPNVVLIQKKTGVKVDGIFGGATERSVKAFQTKLGVKADGVIGPYTWSKMFK